MGPYIASGTVKKVIVTSSMAAVSDCFEPGKIYDENDWNETSSLTRNPYYYSKVLAEKAAYEFVNNLPEEQRFELVTINPFLVMGPALDNSINASVSTFLDLLNGKFSTGVPDLCYGIVDVRDVALSHILAMENPNSKGRYVCCHGPYTFMDLSNMIKEKYPAYCYPNRVLPNFIVLLASKFESKGIRDFFRNKSWKKM